MTGFFQGLWAALRGCVTAIANAGVRRAYYRLIATLAVMTIVLDAAAITTLWFVTADFGDVARWSARIVGTLLSLLLMPALALWSTNVIFPMSSARLYQAALSALDPDAATKFANAEGISVRAGIAGSLRRLVALVVGSAAAASTSMIPVVGLFLAPPLQAIVTARFVAWELLDPYFEAEGVAFQDARECTWRHLGACIGFGLPASLLMAVPVLGSLCFGLVQAAVPRFVLEVLEPRNEAWLRTQGGATVHFGQAPKSPDKTK